MGFDFFFGKREEFVDFLCGGQVGFNLDFPDFVTRVVLPDLFYIPFFIFTVYDDGDCRRRAITVRNCLNG